MSAEEHVVDAETQSRVRLRAKALGKSGPRLLYYGTPEDVSKKRMGEPLTYRGEEGFVCADQMPVPFWIPSLGIAGQPGDYLVRGPNPPSEISAFKPEEFKARYDYIHYGE